MFRSMVLVGEEVHVFNRLNFGSVMKFIATDTDGGWEYVHSKKGLMGLRRHHSDSQTGIRAGFSRHLGHARSGFVGCNLIHFGFFEFGSEI
jgi:hypothetical protein